MIDYNVRLGMQLPKIEQKGRDPKHSFKWGATYVKMGERSQKVGGCLKCKKLFVKARVTRKFIN